MWLSSVAKRDTSLDFILNSPILRRVFRKLPAPKSPYTAGLLIDEKGNVLKKVPLVLCVIFFFLNFFFFFSIWMSAESCRQIHLATPGEFQAVD
jgi:hypothetical protein